MAEDVLSELKRIQQELEAKQGVTTQPVVAPVKFVVRAIPPVRKLFIHNPVANPPQSHPATS